MAKKPETLFKERIMPTLKALPNTWLVKTQQVSIRGTPDILMCISGIFVALELKTNKGKVDKLQRYTLDKINFAGGYGLVIDPNNWDDAYRLLLRLSNKEAVRLEIKHEVLL